jgi:hypothetical protein
MAKPGTVSRAWRLIILICLTLAVGLSAIAAARKRAAAPAAEPTPAPQPAAPRPMPKALPAKPAAPPPNPSSQQPGGNATAANTSSTQATTGNGAPSSPQLLGSNRKRERLKWFYDQRAYPSGHIPENARGKALAQMDYMIQREIQMGLRSAPVADGIIPFPGSTTNWLFIGPRPINEIFGGNGGSPTASGRVTSLAIDPSDATGNTVYLGGAEGGVWKTIDGGVNWATNFDLQPSLSIGAVAVAPSSPSTVYVGTGEENFAGDNFYGAGVIKSPDGGAHWAPVGVGGNGGTITGVTGITSFTGPFATTLGGAFIGSLSVNPLDANTVLAGARIFSNAGSGIYCSNDGGMNWSLKVAGPAGTSVVYANSTNAFAAIGALGGDPTNGIYISTNANLPCASQTWTKLTINVVGVVTANFGRITLAIAPSTPTTIYAAIADSSVTSSDLLAILKSTDGGATWTQPNSTTTPDFCAGQCWYDVAIAVHPTNANLVVVGGSAFTNNSSTLFRSTDGGTTWTSGGADDFTIGSTSVRPHVDTHALAFASTGATPRLYTGDDGGVWRTDDPTVIPHVVWVDLNNTLGLTQFYPGMGVHPSDQNIIYGGNQDNGTPKYSGTLDWTDMGVCGDGGYFAIDPIVPSTVYASCQAYSINRSVQNGDVISGIPSFTGITTGINQSDSSQFIPPLVIDSSLSNRLYFGTCRIWQTMDRGDTWTAISADLSAGNVGDCSAPPGNISAIDVLLNDSNKVVAATTNGRVWRTLNAGAGAGATWSDITGTGLSTRFITSIKTKRSDSTGNILYATFSGFSGNSGNFIDNLGHVFKTTNGGVTWSDISGNLPNIPVNAIVVDHNTTPVFDALYIGTDIGVFTCATPEMATPCTNWTMVGAGLPRVPVLSLEEQRASRNLLAGTHGRGAWNFQLNEVAVPAAPFLSGISPATTDAGVPSSGTLTLTLQGNFDVSSIVLMDGTSTGIVTHALVGNQITADIPASRFLNGGESAITVGESNSASVSSALEFTIVGPQPTIATVTPGSVNAGNGGNPLDVAVIGTNFDCSTAAGPTGGTAGTKLRFNGIDHDFKASPPCTASSATFTIPSGEIFTPGSISMFTFTPSPGGGQSPSSFSFTVNPMASNNFTNGGGDGQWTTATNWSLGHVPLATEAVTDTGGLNITLASGAQSVSAMTFNNGGTLAITGGSLTFTSPSTATIVTLNGGTLTANATLTVAGAATLATGGILSGSSVVTLNGVLTWSGGTISMATPAIQINTIGGILVSGPGKFSSGTLVVPGTATFSAGLDIGGNAAINILSGGTFNLNGDFSLASASIPGNSTINNAGTVAKTAGTTVTGGGFGSTVTFNNTGTVTASSGILNFAGGYFQTGANSQTSLSGGNIAGNLTVTGGTLSGNGTVTGNVSNAATLKPGNLPGVGTIAINGSYTQTGALNVELDGITAGQFSVLNVTGTANLGGTLNVTVGGGFTPPADSTYVVATYPLKSGDFATKNFNGLPLGETTNATNVTMTGPAGAPASIMATAGSGQSANINSQFAQQLQATVTDASSIPAPNVVVTFTAPAQTGPSGTFAGGVNTAMTNVSGIATSAVFTANANVGGPYIVTATVSGVAAPANFTLTNTVGPPASVTATGGTPQNTMVNTVFGSPLPVVVKDSGGSVISGVTVTFTAPAQTGASGTFAGGVNTATTSASGVAISAIFTANSISGGPYNVTASVAGVATPATFSLTNNPGPAASLTATAGTPQSSTASTAFSTAMKATVKDASGNPVPGASVTFTAPSSGASGTFTGGGASSAGSSDSSGVATAPTFTANSTGGGPYNVTASVAGISASATFVLTNVDFTLAQATTGTVQITPGTPSNIVLNLTTTPANAALPADVNYTCAVPASLSGTTCAVNPVKTAAGSMSGSTTLMITTTANVLPSPQRRNPWTPYLPWAAATVLSGLMAIFFAEWRNVAPLRGRMAYVTLVLLLIATVGLVGCMTLPPALTQKGASSVTVTSASAGVAKTTTVNINVN